MFSLSGKSKNQIPCFPCFPLCCGHPGMLYENYCSHNSNQSSVACKFHLLFYGVRLFCCFQCRRFLIFFFIRHHSCATNFLTWINAVMSHDESSAEWTIRNGEFRSCKNTFKKKECIPVGCVPPAHWPYLILSHACPPTTMHTPLQPHTPPQCMPPLQPCMPPATMHTPYNHACPPCSHTCPPNNHACPPATTQPPHTPPDRQV